MKKMISVGLLAEDYTGLKPIDRHVGCPFEDKSELFCFYHWKIKASSHVAQGF